MPTLTHTAISQCTTPRSRSAAVCPAGALPLSAGMHPQAAITALDIIAATPSMIAKRQTIFEHGSRVGGRCFRPACFLAAHIEPVEAFARRHQQDSLESLQPGSHPNR